METPALAKYNIDDRDDTFYYQFLARLITDCKYYAGHGNRSTANLWCEDIDDMIEIMNEIYYCKLPVRPYWCSPQQLHKYTRMLL